MNKSAEMKISALLFAIHLFIRIFETDCLSGHKRKNNTK